MAISRTRRSEVAVAISRTSRSEVAVAISRAASATVAVIATLSWSMNAPVLSRAVTRETMSPSISSVISAGAAVGGS